MTFVEPAYGHRSLADVVPAVAVALGRPLAHRPRGLDLPPAGAYIVLLVDGLGANLLERHHRTAPYLSSLMQGSDVGTAGVPSTTATSITSLGTGLVPGAHGLIGFTARLAGTDTLIDHLRWDRDVDPVVYQPHPPAFEVLAEAGVHVSVVNKREFRGSGLTVAGQRGATYVGADRVGERIAGALAASSERPSLTYLYDSDLDWTGHRFGVASSQWLQQLAMIDAECEQLREALPVDRRLVIVADHGMVDSPPESRVDVDDHGQLRAGVALMGGEARFRALYCRPGAAGEVLAAWRELLGDRADVLTRDDAVARGWFGPVEPRVLERLGDVIVAARGDLGVFSREQFKYETTLVGLHGSLTADEMLIPILVD